MREKRRVKEGVEIVDSVWRRKKSKKKKEKEIKRMVESEMKKGKII